MKQRRSAVQILKQFKEGSLKPSQYMEQLLDISNQTTHLNHFIEQNRDEMLENSIKADKRYEEGINRPLEGIPIGVKDNIDVGGYPTTGGSPALLGHVPQYDSLVWQKIRFNGAIMGGKTNMSEFAMSTVTNNAFYGKARSAVDEKITAGGSSGGSAGAVGCGSLPIAIGTDTAGSIRIPAMCNQVIGYKPTINHWPSQEYGLKLTHSKDSIGPIAQCMDDILYLNQVVTEQMPLPSLSPKDITIGLPNTYFFDDIDPDIEEAFSRAVQILENAGFTIQRNDSINKIDSFINQTSQDLINYEAPRRLKEYLQRHSIKKTSDQVIAKLFSDDTRKAFRNIQNKPVSELRFRQIYFYHRYEFIKECRSYFERNSIQAFIYPTMVIKPCLVDEYKESNNWKVEHNGRNVNYVYKSIQNTDVASIVNFPSISIPIRKDNESDALVNLEICCQTGDDQQLLAIAKLIEPLIY